MDPQHCLLWLKTNFPTHLHLRIDSLGCEKDTTVVCCHYGAVGKQGCVPARQHLQPELGHHNLPVDIRAILYSWEAGLCSSQATPAAGTGTPQSSCGYTSNII